MSATLSCSVVARPQHPSPMWDTRGLRLKGSKNDQWGGGGGVLAGVGQSRGKRVPEFLFKTVLGLTFTVQSKSSDPLSKLLQQNTGHYKDTPISSIFDLWRLTLSFWLSLDAFTTIESQICEKCEQIKDSSSQWQGGGFPGQSSHTIFNFPHVQPF